MSGTDCEKCGAHVTVKGLNWCPLCRAPMKPLPGRVNEPRGNGQPAPAAHAKPSPPVFRAPVRYKFSGRDWFALVCVSAIVILLVMIVYRVIVPSDSKRHDDAVREALHLCQSAITSVAEFGAAETPPYAQNYGKQDDFYFAWPKGSFEFTNGFGAKVKMSASCNGKVSTGQITSLTVNGKDFR